MYNIGICDDKLIYIKKIKSEISEHFINRNKKIKFHLFNDGIKVVNSINKLDLLFLDIEMPNLNGIEVKDRINGYCKIIFVTNYEQHMYEAFGKNVIAFIKKDELYRISDILTKIEQEEKEHKIVQLGDQLIDIDSILYAKAEGSYTHIFTIEKDFFECIYLSQTLKKINCTSFIRVHKSYIINMKYIKKINSKNILLINNSSIPLSRLLKKDVTEQFYNYIKSRI
jgi:Response regulator of the LytR/AlgR family